MTSGSPPNSVPRHSILDPPASPPRLTCSSCCSSQYLVTSTVCNNKSTPNHQPHSSGYKLCHPPSHLLQPYTHTWQRSSKLLGENGQGGAADTGYPRLHSQGGAALHTQAAGTRLLPAHNRAGERSVFVAANCSSQHCLRPQGRPQRTPPPPSTRLPPPPRLAAVLRGGARGRGVHPAVPRTGGQHTRYHMDGLERRPPQRELHPAGQRA